MGYGVDPGAWYGWLKTDSIWFLAIFSASDWVSTLAPDVYAVLRPAITAVPTMLNTITAITVSSNRLPLQLSINGRIWPKENLTGEWIGDTRAARPALPKWDLNI